MSIEKAVLYVVSTPIGNLGDISRRALDVLRDVDRVAAEDTRRTAELLHHFSLDRPLVALHDHNERDAIPGLLARMAEGESIALVSDAGTPLVSDPGFHLVRAVRAAGFKVVPVPGASALLAALAAAGLPTDRFVFEGFLPAKGAAREARLRTLQREPRTMVFFEAPHRVIETLLAMAEAFGPGRGAVVARELTKLFETIRGDTLGALVQWVESDPNQRKGEIVIVVEGAPEQDEENEAERERVLRLLLAELPLKRAVSLAAAITGAKKNALYDKALAIVGEGGQE